MDRQKSFSFTKLKISVALHKLNLNHFILQILSILRNVLTEMTEPKLKISIFDQERNSAAKEGMKRRVSSIYMLLVNFPYRKETITVILMVRSKPQTITFCFEVPRCQEHHQFKFI